MVFVQRSCFLCEGTPVALFYKRKNIKSSSFAVPRLLSLLTSRLFQPDTRKSRLPIRNIKNRKIKNFAILYRFERATMPTSRECLERSSDAHNPPETVLKPQTKTQNFDFSIFHFPDFVCSLWGSLVRRIERSELKIAPR